MILKRTLLSLTGLVLLFLAVGCSGPHEGDRSTAASAAAIEVGAVLPLTGSAAEWGTPVRKALLLAQDEINGSGGINGKKIHLNIEDDRCDASGGISALQKIIATQRPVAVIGAVCSAVTLAIAPVAERSRIVLISPASTNPAITNAGDYIFRVIPTDALRGTIFARYVYAQGHRTVSLLYIKNDAGVGNKDSFAAEFRRLGGRVASEDSYPENSRDVRSQLAKIAAAKPDAIMIVSYPEDSALVLRQAHELGIQPPLYFQTEALDDPNVIKNAAGAADGVTYILPAPATGGAAVAFADKYKRKWGGPPETFAAEGYDSLMLIATLLRKTATVSSDVLKSELYKTADYAGASGTITFDGNGDVLKPMAIKRIVNGNPVIVETRRQ